MTSSGGSGPRDRRLASVSPSRYSMTRKAMPSCSPMSWSTQMCGWFKRRDRARLAVEPLAQLRVVCEDGREDLDGDRAVEPGVAGLVHLAHAASANRGNHLVRAQSGPWRERHHDAAIIARRFQARGLLIQNPFLSAEILDHHHVAAALIRLRVVEPPPVGRQIDAVGGDGPRRCKPEILPSSRFGIGRIALCRAARWSPESRPPATTSPPSRP